MIKAAELSGADNILFRRNSVTGAVEAVPRQGGASSSTPPCMRTTEHDARTVPSRGRRRFWSSSASSPRVGIALLRGSGPSQTPRDAGRSREVMVELDLEQAENAAVIAAVGVRRGLPARAVSIALATAFQESKMRNLDHGDRDSLGLFQQRPSKGWGTRRADQRPLLRRERLLQRAEKVAGFEGMRITEAAQAVQRSGFPEAYEDHADDARSLASALTGYCPAAVHLRGAAAPARDLEEGAAGPDSPSGAGAPRPRAGHSARWRSAGSPPAGCRRPQEGSAHYDGRAIDVFVRPMNEANNRKGWAVAQLPRRQRQPARHRPRHLRRRIWRRRAVRAGLARLRPPGEDPVTAPVLSTGTTSTSTWSPAADPERGTALGWAGSGRFAPAARPSTRG